MIATQKIFIGKMPLNYNALSFTVEDQTGILSGPLNTDEQQNVSLVDAGGNILQNKTFTPVNGQAYVTFEMDNYTKGTYHLVFENKIRQIDLQGMIFDGIFLQTEDTAFLEDYKISILNVSDIDKEADIQVTNSKTGEVSNITLPELNGPWSILYNNAVNVLGIDLAASYIDEDSADLIVGRKGNVTSGQKVSFDGQELSFIDILSKQLIYKDSQQEYRILDLTRDVVAYSPGADFYVHSHFIKETEAVLEIDVPRDLRDDYADGYSDGYLEGINDGTELGKLDGYDNGYNDGKVDGYLDGVNASIGQILDLTEQLGAANAEINNLEEDLEEAENENTKLDSDLENATSKIDELEDKIDDLEDALDDVNNTADEEKKDKNEMEQKYLLYRNLFYTSCGGVIIATTAFGLYTYASRHEVRKAKDSLEEHVLTAKDLEDEEKGEDYAKKEMKGDEYFEEVDADKTLKGYEKDEIDLIMEKSIDLKEKPKSKKKVRRIMRETKKEPQDYTPQELTTGRTDEFPELTKLYNEDGNGVDTKKLHAELIADSEMPETSGADPLYANWKGFPGCAKPTNKSYTYMTKKYNTPQELEEDYRLNPEGALEYVNGIKSKKTRDKVIKHLEDLD
jgi:hypothetical protein